MKPNVELYNLYDLQLHVGYLDTGKGIFYMVTSGNILEELLEEYIELVDNALFYQFSLRQLRFPYAVALAHGNIEYVRKSIWTAIMSELYNLRVLIESTKFEYEPLENYYVKERIVTTASIASTAVIGALDTTTTTSYGEFVINKNDNLGKITLDVETSRDSHETLETYNHGQVSKTTDVDMSTTVGNHTDTLNRSVGEQINSTQGTDEFGSHTDNVNEQNNVDKRRQTSDIINEVSAYNTSDYQPNSTTNEVTNADRYTDETITNSTIGAHTDTHNSTMTSGSRSDKDTNVYGERLDTNKGTNTETTEGYLDTKTIKVNPYEDHDITTTSERTNTYATTENPHSDTTTEKVGERNNKENTDSGENKDRETRGRYGFTTTQSLIEAQRKLANLNMVERIINIILRDLTLGVLSAW